MKLKLYRKSVQLDGFNIHKDLQKINLGNDLEISHKQITKDSTHSSFISSSKENINNKLQELSKDVHIIDRCRTLDNIPKYRIINTDLVRIN